MKVKLIAHTPNPEMVVACAAKLCYSKVGVEELMEKQTPEGIEKFLNMLMGMGHESPIEHVSFTFAAEGVSRALTHQLVRHRLASYSQQSQRYVNLENTFEYITPKEIAKYPYIKDRYARLMNHIFEEYVAISHELLIAYIYEYLVEEKKIYSPDIMQDTELMKKIMKEVNKKKYSQFEKIAIENARYVLPNSCETKIVFTMNARVLLNFLAHRDCSRAQDEIRDMAREVRKQLIEVAPTLFKYSGAGCRRGKCPEGAYSCGKPLPKVV